LIDAYQPGILWFDGEWEDAWTHERGKDLYAWLRAKDPKLIINNRVDKGRAGMQGHTKDEKFKGDYGTPEQEIPATGFGPGVSWESCMTMNNTWGYKADDHQWKSAGTLVRNLIDIASKGGNYLLNVGPTGAGEIPAPSLERLEEIGRWMKVHGESIHGTTASLFPKLSWNGRSTTKRTKNGKVRVYLHVFQRPAGGLLTLKGLVEKPASATLLGSPTPLSVAGEAGAWTIKLPDSLDPMAAVVALDFAASPTVRETVAEPDADGVLKLDAMNATMKGHSVRIEGEHIGYWTDARDHVVWKARMPAGIYQVEIDGALPGGTSVMRLTCGGASLEFKVEPTGSWSTFKNRQIGELKIDSPQSEVSVHPVSKQGEGFVNLRSVTLRGKR
jgi:alpha-L-fucosidase